MKTAYVDNSNIRFWLLGGLGEEWKERLGKYEGPKVTDPKRYLNRSTCISCIHSLDSDDFYQVKIRMRSAELLSKRTVFYSLVSETVHQ